MALERWVGICPVENESVNEERSKQRKFHVLNPEIGMYMLCQGNFDGYEESICNNLFKKQDLKGQVDLDYKKHQMSG